MPSRTTIMGLSVTLALCVAQATSAEEAPQAKVLHYSGGSGGGVGQARGDGSS